MRILDHTTIDDIDDCRAAELFLTALGTLRTFHVAARLAGVYPV